VLLQVHNVRKFFGAVQALNNVTFQCDESEILGLVGENGAGKSTLLKILAGAFSPDSGEIRFQGEVVEAFQPELATRRGISIIYQELSLIPALTVAENIYVGRERVGRLGHINRKTMNGDAEKLLAGIGLPIDPSRPIDSLSIAEQQVVEIARALSQRAKLLILDEPTAALADREAEKLLAIMRSLRAAGTAILFVSHRLYEILEIADVITVMKDGKVVGSDRASAFNENRMISMMVGRELEHAFPPKRQAEKGEAAMRAAGLTARDGSFRDVNLTLYQGEILGVAGLEGHGQRELLRTLFGLHPLSGGSVEIHGRRIDRLTPRHCIDNGTAFVSDDRKTEGLVLPFDICRNVSLATLKQRQTLSLIDEKAERAVAQAIAADLKVHPLDIRRIVRTLSGGNQQKVVLARWLISNPKILLLSEPTRGIDVGTKVEIYELLRRLAADGLGIILVSRDMLELLGLSDRILVMANGRLAAELEGAEATEESIMAAIVRGSGPRVDWQSEAPAA
jgi:ABC-type sugar transport system ATPase subunit